MQDLRSDNGGPKVQDLTMTSQLLEAFGRHITTRFAIIVNLTNLRKD